MYKVLKEAQIKSQQNSFFPVTTQSYASFPSISSMFPTVPGAVENEKFRGETDWIPTHNHTQNVQLGNVAVKLGKGLRVGYRI